MCEGRLYSVDCIEGEVAVLVADDGVTHTVSVADLPDVKAGNVYRNKAEAYYRDLEAETMRKERVRGLQKRLSASQ